MKKLCVSILLGAAMSTLAFAQGKQVSKDDAAAEAVKAFREEVRLQKLGFADAAGRPDAGPSDYADTDSFGKNVQFLGSFYAGTVYVLPDCTAAGLAAIGLTLAPDDHCVTKTPNVPLNAQTIFDPTWQITIPGKSAKNVIYLLLNNSVQAFAANYDLGTATGGFTYQPVVTLESSALNHPQAIDPVSGLPMNGKFTTGLPGALVKSYTLAEGQFQSDFSSYGSVNGRGFSRQYFRAIGLPERVIDNLFKTDLKLKFGITFRALTKTEDASFFYQLRVLGQ